jgi:predicted NBD/HSP70 family sugar kinase
MRIAALDIGGTRIKAGLFVEGKLLRTAEADTLAKQGAKVMLQNAASLLESIGSIDAVGISTAGQVDPNTGIIRYANENLPGYTGTNVQKFFSEYFHCPCAVMNDAYCAAVGEGTDGAAKDQADYICITYGTGIGGGVILDHRPYYGKGGSANLMIGGLITHPELRDPNDPFAGSYERCASTAALVRIAKEKDPSLDNGRKIFARIDEPIVKDAVNAWLDEVSVGLLSILHIYNIPCLVLGGGILEQPFVLHGIKERIVHSAIPGFQDVTIASAQLGNQAGLYGAMRNVENKLSAR